MAKKRKVKIISDGRAVGTQVLVDGEALKNVKSVTIGEIVGGSGVNATIELMFTNVELDIVADATIKEISHE